MRLKRSEAERIIDGAWGRLSEIQEPERKAALAMVETPRGYSDLEDLGDFIEVLRRRFFMEPEIEETDIDIREALDDEGNAVSVNDIALDKLLNGRRRG